MNFKQNKYTKKARGTNRLEQYIINAIEAYRPKALRLDDPRTVINYIAYQVDTVERIKAVFKELFYSFWHLSIFSRYKGEKTA